MQPTNEHLQESADSSGQSPSSLAFLEAPTIALCDRELGKMSYEEISSLLADLRVLNQKPGELGRRLKDEATAIREKKPRVAKKKTALFDALV